MLKLHKKGSNCQFQRQLLATISLPSARGCYAAVWWPASGSPHGSGSPVWAYRVTSPDCSLPVTPPPWGRWSPGATAPQTFPHPPHHPRSLLQQTTIMFVTINILPESLKCFADPKNVVKPVIVHISRCAMIQKKIQSFAYTYFAYVCNFITNYNLYTLSML